MTGSPLEFDDVRGFLAPVHRALTERICLAAHRVPSPSSTVRSPEPWALAFASGSPVW